MGMGTVGHRAYTRSHVIMTIVLENHNNQTVTNTIFVQYNIMHLIFTYEGRGGGVTAHQGAVNIHSHIKAIVTD